jgi:protein TonB
VPWQEASSRHVRLLACLAISAMAHALVLGVAPGYPIGMRGDEGAPQPRPPLRVALPVAGRMPPVVTPPSLAVPSASAAEKSTERPAEDERTARGRHAPSPRTGAARPSHPSGMFPGPWYYPARYLHRRPTPLKPIWPDYPTQVETVHGRVVILLLINEEGAVDQYRVTTAEPEGIFETPVIAAFSAARFAPGMIAGRAVKSQLLAEVTFVPGSPPQATFSIVSPESR